MQRSDILNLTGEYDSVIVHVQDDVITYTENAEHPTFGGVLAVLSRDRLSLDYVRNYWTNDQRGRDRANAMDHILARINKFTESSGEHYHE